MKQTKIRFQGCEYLLIGDLVYGGAIATQEQYENGQCSYAQLMSDGSVMRFRNVIGSRDEIEQIAECDTEIKCSIMELITNKSWRQPEAPK